MEDNEIVIIVLLAILVILIILSLYWQSKFITIDKDEHVIAAITKAIDSYNAANDRASYAIFLVDYDAAEILINNLTQPWSDGVTISLNNFKNMSSDKYVRYISILKKLILIAPKLSDPKATDAEKDAAAAILVEYVKIHRDFDYNDIPPYIYDIMVVVENKYREILQPPTQEIIELVLAKIVAKLEKSRDTDPPCIYDSFLAHAQTMISKMDNHYNLKGFDVKIKDMKPKTA